MTRRSGLIGVRTAFFSGRSTEEANGSCDRSHIRRVLTRPWQEATSAGAGAPKPAKDRLDDTQETVSRRRVADGHNTARTECTERAETTEKADRSVMKLTAARRGLRSRPHQHLLLCPCGADIAAAGPGSICSFSSFRPFHAFRCSCRIVSRTLSTRTPRSSRSCSGARSRGARTPTARAPSSGSSR